MKNKKILIPILIIIIITSTIVSIYLLTKDKPKEVINNNEFNTSTNNDALKNITISDLKVTNQLIKVNDGISTYGALITNTKSTDYQIDKLYVTFYYDDNETTSLVLSDTKLLPKEEKYIEIIIDSDISKVNKIEYTQNKE